MPTPGDHSEADRGRNRLQDALVRMLRNEEGTTAVEFAIVSVPFLSLVMAILETALAFFAGQAFETAVASAGRLIRTGQAQEDGLTADTFKQKVCTQVAEFMDCSKIYVEVKRYATFGDVSFGLPIDSDGKLKTIGYEYSPGHGGDIVVVRAYYEWPVFFNRLGGDTSNLADGNHLLSAAAAFRNEPFPW